MLTRRRIVAASIAGGALLRARASFAVAAQPATPVSFEVPRGACDCHTHIHGDPEKFPFFAGRVYTPEMALPEEMAALHRALGMQRVVIVTPSVYGTDNFFFFQAEDGIRDLTVTGVQTCALPI